MAKNNKSIKPKREMSRQQLSNWQKQERRQRLVLYIAIGVVIMVFLVIGMGWYISDFQPRHQKVLIVNGTVFSMDYYLTALKYYSGNQATSVAQIEPSLVASIEEGQFVRDGARELGISIADNETETKLKSLGLTKEYREFIRAELLAQKVFAHFQSLVPTNADYRHIMAFFVESEVKAREILKNIEVGDNFTGTAALLSEDSYTRQQEGDLGFQMRDVLALPSYLDTRAVGDYAFSAPADNTTIALIRDDAKVKKLGYWLVKITDREIQTSDNQTTDNQTTMINRVRISGILLGSWDEADMVKARLDAGDNFTALANELSQDNTSREQGGDLGWFSPDTIRPAFELFALNSSVTLEMVSDVIRDTATVTTGGYWLVKVVEKDDNREVIVVDRDLLAETAYTDWYTPLRTNTKNKIDILITEKQRAWAVETARRELSQ